MLVNASPEQKRSLMSQRWPKENTAISKADKATTPMQALQPGQSRKTSMTSCPASVPLCFLNYQLDWSWVLKLHFLEVSELTPSVPHCRLRKHRIRDTVDMGAGDADWAMVFVRFLRECPTSFATCGAPPHCLAKVAQLWSPLSKASGVALLWRFGACPSCAEGKQAVTDSSAISALFLPSTVSNESPRTKQPKNFLWARAMSCRVGWDNQGVGCVKTW